MRAPAVKRKTDGRSPMRWARKESVNRPNVIPAQNPEVTKPTLAGSPCRNWTRKEIIQPEIATSAP